MVKGNDKPHGPQRLRPWLSAVALAVLATVTISLTGAAADFAKGVAAYDAKDYDTAFREWLPLAEDGDPAAQRNIGHLYRRGLGVEQNLKQAIRWYREAAERGFDRAQANLAYMYLNGDGVSRDYALAAEWFYRAAIQGHPVAQYNLGQMYQLGWGVPKDRGRAMAWYNLAAKAGHDKALDRLSVLVLQSGPPQLEQDGGESLPAGMPEGEPGWDEEPIQVARSPAKAKTTMAEAEPAEAPVQRVEQPLPPEKRVAVATLAPPPEPTAPPAAADRQPEQAPVTDAAAPETAAREDDADTEDEESFISRFFSLKARPGETSIPGTRESVFGAVSPESQSEAVRSTAPAEETASQVPAPEDAAPEKTPEPAVPVQAATDADTASPTIPAEPTPVQAAPTEPAKPWVNPDQQPDPAVAAAASNAAAPEKTALANPATGTAAPETAANAEPSTSAALPTRPEIKITVINPPPDDEGSETAESAGAETRPAEPKKEEKGFFARLFGGSDSNDEAEDGAAGTADTGQADTTVVDLTALPGETAPSDAAATDLAPKVKGVEIAVLTPPADKIAAATGAADTPASAAVESATAPRLAPQPAVIEQTVPIPAPETGPTERDAKNILAQKTAVAGRPRQRADDNPREFFAPKVTIDWNTVLEPSSKFSSPAPEKQAAETATPDKSGKSKSLGDSDQATLTALAADQGLIEPLQLGLLAYRSKDYKTAIKYWLPMAHSGKSRAQFYMGGLYHDGTGVDRDPVQAFMWWSLAADKGYNPALTARERLRDRMTDVEVAEGTSLVRTWRPVDE